MRAMKDKVIVITGASAGIGAALARDVVERGATRRARRAPRSTKLEAVAQSSAIGALAVPTDVTRRADNERFAIARSRSSARSTSGSTTRAAASRAWSRELTDDDIDDMMHGQRQVACSTASRRCCRTSSSAKRGQIIAVSSGLVALSVRTAAQRVQRVRRPR